MANVGVLGAGSWGTALSVLLHDNGHEVTIWSIDQKEVEMLNTKREHESKLPGVKLAKEIVITNELNNAIHGKDFLVLAVPSIFTRATARKMSPFVAEGQMIVDVAKGIEEATLMTLSEQIHQEIPQADVAVLSGPSHAEEVGRKLPTTCVIGAKTKKTAEYLQSMFNSRVFRVYTSPDILGIELGGALKNVIALAAGIADGLGYGDNTKAALITRGIAEIARLGMKMGGKLETFTGLTGIGDLIVTCCSMHSRNRRCGILIGKGTPVEEAVKEIGAVVEGYCGDMTRTIAVGHVNDEQRKVYDIVLRSQLAGLEACRAGVRCRDVDHASRSIIADAGYGEYYIHGTGHGVGREVHEAPTLNAKSDEILEEFMPVTVEPGIYIPDKFGVRIEDLAISTEFGIINAVKSQKSLIII